jgi:hypothetical protein
MAVAFDAVGPSASGAAGPSLGSPASLTWTHVVGSSLTNSVLYAAGVYGNNGGSDVSETLTATYGGVSMTSISKVHANASTSGFIEVFRLLSPTAGSASVVVTVGGSGGSLWSLTGGSCSYQGVDQTTPETVQSAATGSGTTATKAFTVPTNSIGLWCCCAGNSLSAANQTSRWLRNLDGGSAAGNSAMQDAAGTSASITGSWSVAVGDFWGIASMIINVAAAAGGPPPPFPFLQTTQLAM